MEWLDEMEEILNNIPQGVAMQKSWDTIVIAIALLASRFLTLDMSDFGST